MVQVRAQSAGGPLVLIPDQVLALAEGQLATVRAGKGADLVWPGLLRRLSRRYPGHDV